MPTSASRTRSATGVHRLFTAALTVLAGCAPSDGASRDSAASSAAAVTPGGSPYAYERLPLDTTRIPGATIDSVFPMPEMIRRFRVGLPELSALNGGESSRQALVTAFTAALAAQDARALGTMALSRAEFASLYFPNTPDATRAMGLPPQRKWDQIVLNSEKGIGRALSRLGGTPLTLQSLDCPNPPITSGPMKLHEGCLVHLRRGDGTAFDGRIFGSIIEYGGRFKFVGYSNDM